MKKSLFFAAIAIIFMSCEGPMGPEGPRGRDGEPNWFSTPITINANEWILKGNPGDLNSYFYVYKQLPQLTKYIYESGSVLAYIETDYGVKNGMPFVLHKGEEFEGEEFLWTQTYDFDFSTGEVGFYMTYSDFSTQLQPNTETFHIVLFW